VVPSNSEPCTHGQFSRILATGDGYISSVLTEETDRGSFRCPWLIEAADGQRINFTLWDFSGGGTPSGEEASSSTATGGGSSGGSSCLAYAVFRDPVTSQSLTVCGGDGRRIKHVYTSQRSRVEIRLQKNKQTKYFVLHYHGEDCLPRTNIKSSPVWDMFCIIS